MQQNPVSTNSSDELSDLEREQIAEFVDGNAEYYQAAFERIGKAPGYRFTFNFAAAVLGPIWFAFRNLWAVAIPFIILELIALVPLGKGLWSDLAKEEKQRVIDLTKLLNDRREQAAEAAESGASNADALNRLVASLEGSVANAEAAVASAAGNSIQFVLLGLFALIFIKVIQGALANYMLKLRFAKWRSDNKLSKHLSIGERGLAVAFIGTVYAATIARFTMTTPPELLLEFPAAKDVRIDVADAIKAWFGRIVQNYDGVFDGITRGIRGLLDGLEVFFLDAPWIVVMMMVLLLAWRAAGIRVAIFSGAALMYLAVLGFWAQAMATISLLGAAAFISICVGIPVGVLCARSDRAYSIIRPILDFMQTMPSFVYLIPVIAFFGTGKPAGIIATLIFGSPPVIRLTILGLRNVPEHVREAAQAFGVSPMYLLFKVDLPLAAPSIMAGINQTIMISLSMVVIASLIGAKGLGEDVLQALQFASEGQGILAGFAILFCAMILDRVIQGKRK